MFGAQDSYNIQALQSAGKSTRDNVLVRLASGFKGQGQHACVPAKTAVMADKGGKLSGAGQKPIPMNLFATWEVEKSSPNCIPRMCSLTLTRLVVVKPMEQDLHSVVLAVKMQSSKRILRSGEIVLHDGRVLDTELDLSFSLQYPHFLKRDGNRLQIMLQRRKRYKNRTILGYKTLAMGQVNMSQVLQRSVDRELNLYSDPKERNNKVAAVMVLALSSQPVDHEYNGRHIKFRQLETDRSPDIDLSDDEDADDQEDWSNEELSDSEPNEHDDPHVRSHRKSSRFVPRHVLSQRNFKQKFISLLRKFKISEEDQEALDVPTDPLHPQEIEDLFDELEDLSDSGPEMDTISVLSTPKPKLRPFFAGRGSALDILDVPMRECGRLSDDSSRRNDSDSHLDYLTDPEYSDSQCTSLANSAASSGFMNRRESEPPGTPPAAEEKDRSEKSEKSLFMLGAGTVTSANQTSATSQPPVVVHASSSPPHGGSSPGAFARATSMREKLSAKKEKLERRLSAGNGDTPRKVLLDQLSSVLQADESQTSLPDTIVMINIGDWHGQLLSQILPEHQFRIIHTNSSADVRATLSYIVNKIQKFCNNNSRQPSPIKIALAGGDGYVNMVLRPFVEQFSNKSHDWQGYLRFLFVPLGTSSLAKYLASVDNMYSSMFYDQLWKDVFEKAETPRPADIAEVTNRISCYLSSASNVANVPIAEAMITYKDKHDDESSQIFVPFINEVRVGPIDLLPGASCSLDFEESSSVTLTSSSQGGPLSSSPPHQQNILLECKARDTSHTPPSSPNVNIPSIVSSGGQPTCQVNSGSSPPESLDLQLDYWSMDSKQTELGPRDRLQKKDSKASLKSTFKCVRVYRLPQSPSSDLNSSSLSMVLVTKEKKQKMVMRLGKKSKADEPKSQLIEGISRLICTSKAQSHALTVTIDNVDWHGVKFFQISGQWQTHIKHLPLVLFGPVDGPL